MDGFNLLSIADKNTLNKLRLYFYLKNITFKIISVFVIFSVIIFFTNTILSNNINSLENQIQNEKNFQQKEQINSIEDATDQLNKQLNLASLIQNKYIKWTDFLNLFIQKIPLDIKLTSLEFLTSTKDFKTNGTAENRDGLLIFQKNLNLDSHFSNINTPISSLIQKENIDFEITGKLTDLIYK